MSTLPLWASAVIGACIFFVLMFLRLHVGLSLMVAGFIGFTMTRGVAAAKIGMVTTIYEVGSSPILVILPLFITMGIIAGEGGVISAAFGTFKSWLGHYRGGLAMATVGACAAFGAVCGDNIATAAVMNKAALPEMRRYGYHDRLSLGSICAGGNLGIMIPPSAAFVVYGFITQQPIGDLFASGILPGVLLTLMFMGQIALQCKINPSLSSKYEAVSWKQRLISLRGMSGIVVVFAVVMGGLMGGFFTPTEAGAAGSAAILLVSLFYRKLTWKGLGNSLAESARTTAMILLLVMGARYFSYFLTSTEVATSLSNLLVEANLNRYLVMMLVCIVFLILGCLMDIWSVMIITLPIFFDLLVTHLGFNPLQLGVITVLCIMIGCITPPVGVVVFAISGMHPEVPMYSIFRGIWPFVGTMVLLLLILIFVPWLSTALPSLGGGG
jgi:tripartite ATP-independent transporter DctM subunit